MSEHFGVLAGSDEVGAAWFEDISRRILQESALLIGGRPYRLREIEFYYNGGDHPDPFAHGDPVQQTTGRWYFHRDQGSYRGGSFKGLDITFGPEGVVGGILIRSMSGPDGEEVNGSCLCVDHMLARTGMANVAALDAAHGERKVWEEGGPLRLVPASLPALPMWSTARVGLTLKRAWQHEEMPSYIMRPYRFLTEPRWIKKGKLHLVIALHQQGRGVAEINALTGTPRGTIQGYVDKYQEGLALDTLKGFRGKALDNDDLATLHGAWTRRFVQEA